MLNILVVDDSKTIHSYIEDCLKDSKCNLTHAYNGSEAIAQLELKKDYFDLILLDWEMPVLTGPETVRALVDKGNTTPIIMVTTKGNTLEITAMISDGVREYIVKPFTKDILIDKIADVVEETFT